MASSSSSEVKNLMQNLSVQVPVKYPGKLSKKDGGGKWCVSVFLCVLGGVNLDHKKKSLGFSWEVLLGYDSELAQEDEKHLLHQRTPSKDFLLFF